MEINMNKGKKLVEIWLTGAESRDPAVNERLRGLYADYKQRKYFVAVYRSGDAELYRQTSDLICYNRKNPVEPG